MKTFFCTPLRSFLRATVRTVGVAAAAAGLLLAGSAVASAHVTIDASTTTAGSYTLLTVSVPHGCDGSSTTSVAIKIPDAINAVTPSINPGWDVEKKMQQLDKPIDNGHGGQLTERVDQIVYTAKTPLPDGLRDAFVLSLQLPNTPGETLTFPAIQTCETGSTDWIEVAGAGQAEPAHPAPQIVIAANADEGAAESASTGALTWVALILGGLGVVIGGAALLRGRGAR